MSDTSTQAPVPENGVGWVVITNPKVYEGVENPPTAEVTNLAFTLNGMADKGWEVIGAHPEDEEGKALMSANASTPQAAPLPPPPPPPAPKPQGGDA